MGHHSHSSAPGHTPVDASVHQMIILPGGKVRYFCKDGLSSLDVMHVKSLLIFGGDLIPVNCGAANQFSALWQAAQDMAIKAYNSRSYWDQIAFTPLDKTNDYYRANIEN